MDKQKNWLIRFLNWIFPGSEHLTRLENQVQTLQAENDRLIEKCATRGDENAMLQAQLAALQTEIDVARDAYRNIRQFSPEKIIRGATAEAVHADRIEYENNRLRVFVSSIARQLIALQNDIARLTKDLDKSKQATMGALVGARETLQGQ